MKTIELTENAARALVALANYARPIPRAHEVIAEAIGASGRPELSDELYYAATVAVLDELAKQT